jgi:enoyl-CoA hydratase/3-hydroxyacyl-CoA dehydrogenase
MTTAEQGAALAQRLILKAIVEACLVLEEGVSTAREIDLGMMAGAGFPSGPLAGADAWGIDTVVAERERMAEEVDPEFEPPAILRRLVGQGRLGVKSGQGFYPYPNPDEGFAGNKVQLETRGNIAIAWLAAPPANSLSPEVIGELEEIWRGIEHDAAIRVLVIASANQQLFCAGADIKAFSKMEEAGDVRALVHRAHTLMRSMEAGDTVTIAAVNAPAYGGGNELLMACDLRIAAQSAMFGQPEIDLGIIPGFGGTQRLPRLVGFSKALEMNLTGQPIGAESAYEFGLINQVVADHELFDAALLWAKKLAGQAPLAVAATKRAMIAAGGDLDTGLVAEEREFTSVFLTDDAKEGIEAFLGKRSARWQAR